MEVYKICKRRWSSKWSYSCINQHPFNIFINNLREKKAKEFWLLMQSWQHYEHGKDQILILEGLHDIKEWNNRNMDEI